MLQFFIPLENHDSRHLKVLLLLLLLMMMLLLLYCLTQSSGCLESDALVPCSLENHDSRHAKVLLLLLLFMMMLLLLLLLYCLTVVREGKMGIMNSCVKGVIPVCLWTNVFKHV